MPSLDVVSIVDMQTLDNAINNVKREVASRYDFRNVTTEITFDRKGKSIHIVSGDEWKVKAIVDMLIGHLTRLKLSPKCLDVGKAVNSSQRASILDIKIKEGIPIETCQKIVKYIKGLGLKVQPAIQDDKIRVTGKNIDDLREIMRLLLEQDYDLPLQFVNMK